jgi:hypothetical protein
VEKKGQDQDVKRGFGRRTEELLQHVDGSSVNQQSRRTNASRFRIEGIPPDLISHVSTQKYDKVVNCRIRGWRKTKSGSYE